MRSSFVLRLRAEWTRWNAHGSPGAPAVRRDARPWVEGLEGRALLASITEYPINVGTPSPGNGLVGITGGPDGNVYFTDTLNNAIGQITPSGAITELPLSGPVAGGLFKNGLDGITLGADGKLAFTESAQDAIGKITTTGSFNSYPIGSSGSLTGQGPDQITTASDGTLWWTEDGSNAIGELTPAGAFNQYAVPGASSGGIIGPSMKGITVGSDGNIWFTNWSTSGNFIGKMTPTGNLTEYPLPSTADPSGIVSGPDGNLWFTAYGTNTIDVMSTSGALLQQYPAGGSQSQLLDITLGSDKNVYFTEQAGDIGQITTAGVVTLFPVSTTVPTVPGASGPQPLAITSGPDGNIWFTDPWTDSVGVLRIVSSPKSPTPTSPAPTSPTPTSPTPTSPSPTSPTSTSPTTPISTPAPRPMGPTSGPIRTKTELTVHPRSALVGQPVALRASVKAVGDARGIPTGTVVFLDGKTVLGTAAFHGGAVTLQTSSLHAGRNAIRVRFASAAGYRSSESGLVTETVRAQHSKSHIASSPTRPTSTPMGFAIARAEADDERPPDDPRA